MKKVSRYAATTPRDYFMAPRIPLTTRLKPGFRRIRNVASMACLAISFSVIDFFFITFRCVVASLREAQIFHATPQRRHDFSHDSTRPLTTRLKPFFNKFSPKLMRSPRRISVRLVADRQLNPTYDLSFRPTKWLSPYQF